MAEPLRVFALSSVQQAERAVYEGPRYTPWENPYRHSLPPAPDRQPPQTQTQKEPENLVGREIQRQRQEQHRHERAQQRLDRIRQGTADGLTAAELAKELGMSKSGVQNLKTRHGIASPPEAQTLWKLRAQRARRQRERERQAEAEAQTPVAAVARTAAQAQPARTHVLDWQLRMAAWQFEGQPNKPKKARAQKASTGSDFRQVYPMPHMRASSVINANPVHAGVRAINCAATRNDWQQPASKTAENPFKMA